MALNALNSSNLEQLALKGLIFCTCQHYHSECQTQSGQIPGDQPAISIVEALFVQFTVLIKQPQYCIRNSGLHLLTTN